MTADKRRAQVEPERCARGHRPDPRAPSILHLDAHAVKVLAHPLRSRLLSALRSGGPATATSLAQRLDTNTGATSYHLRKLASVGLVEETGEGRGRERPWRAATEMHAFTQRDVAYDPDGRGRRRLAATLLPALLRRSVPGMARCPRVLADGLAGGRRRERLPPPALAAARLAELKAEVNAFVERYRDPDPDDPDATTGRDSTSTRSRSDASRDDHARRPVARRRYLVLIALRWLPTGLLIPISVLLMLSRGLSLTEIGLVYSVQGFVVLALELPDRRAVGLARSPAGADPREPRRAAVARRRSSSPQTLPMFVLAMVLQGVFRALDSGPLEAWYVDATLAADPDARIESRARCRELRPEPRRSPSGALLSGALVALDPVRLDRYPHACRSSWPSGRPSSTSARSSC